MANRKRKSVERDGNRDTLKNELEFCPVCGEKLDFVFQGESYRHFICIKCRTTLAIPTKLFNNTR